MATSKENDISPGNVLNTEEELVTNEVMGQLMYIFIIIIILNREIEEERKVTGCWFLNLGF